MLIRPSFRINKALRGVETRKVRRNTRLIYGRRPRISRRRICIRRF